MLLIKKNRINIEVPFKEGISDISCVLQDVETNIVFKGL